ncbi:MAG: tyrosine-type recombinase/integrase [Actinomycetota bacterium]|nr:tyrosine-type recombinase/integrase [Actinomycetota bacterium]
MSVGTFRTKAAAEGEFARALSDQGRGAWVTPEQGRMALAEYATAWLESRLTSRGEPLRPRVRELYEGYLRLHILPDLGTVPLGRMTTATVRRWHAGLLADGPGPSTVAKCYRLLRAILNTAVEDGHLVINPCSIKGAGVEPCEERSIPTIGQVYALADAVAPRFRALVLLAAFGGLRRGELFGLTRRDLDLLHLTVDVRAQRQESSRGEALIGPPKTIAGRRTLALPTELVPALEDHLARWVSAEPGALVFVGEGGGALRAGVWQREWDRARQSLDLAHLHLHDLRHVAGTLAAATGAGTKEIMRRLGHATQEAALRYQHATDERDRVLAAGIDHLIQAARDEPRAPVVPLRSADDAAAPPAR